MVEGETITLSFTVDGDLPAEGVTVLVNDVTSAQNQARSLTEFDVANVELSGIAEFPIPAEGDSGFYATLIAPTASITIPVFDDGADEDEAAEAFTFALIDGEAYDVDPEAGSVMLNISDVTACQPSGASPQVRIAPEQSLQAILDAGPSKPSITTWPSRAALSR